jgi:hypothetical protein
MDSILFLVAAIRLISTGILVGLSAYHLFVVQKSV